MKKLKVLFLVIPFIYINCASAQKDMNGDGDTGTEVAQKVNYSDAQRKYSSAYEYFRQQNYDRAEELLLEALEDSSTYTDARILLRKVYIQRGQMSKAVETCKEGIECVIELAEEGKLEKDLEEAKRKLTLALADMYVRIDEPEKARELFEDIIKDEPKDANSWDLYASYHERQGNINQAIEYYEKAYKLDPENKGIAFRLGNAYFQANRYEDAVELFNKVKEDFPGDIDVIKKTAESYLQLGKYTEAIDEFKKIIEIAPKHVSSRIKIGNAYREMKNYKMAEKYYREALNIEPKNLSVYYQMINMELEKKNLSAVNSYLNEAFKINPNDPILISLHGEYWYRLGLIKMKNKEWNPSIERFEKAISIWRKAIRKAYDPEWRTYAERGISRASKMIEEVKKVRW